MQDLDINDSANIFEKHLLINNWLECVGTAINVFQTPFQLKKINHTQEIEKALDTDDWVNVDVDTFNDLCAQIDNKNIDPSLINATAKKAGEILKRHRAKLEERLLSLQLKKQFFNTFNEIVIRAFQEYYFHCLNESITMGFNTELLRIVNLGFFPCGWEFAEERIQEAYNPITFINDSYNHPIVPSSFDYHSGFLFVY